MVTIDAMGTQKKIAQLIVSQEADYCLALKGNQGNIHEDVKQLFTQAQAQQWLNIDYNFFETVEKDHGRVEIRRYWTMANVEFLIDSEQWVGLKSIGMVESKRTVAGETTSEIRYYLNSFPDDAPNGSVK